MQGTVKWFDSGKGYGFITGEDGKDAFIHQTAILMNGYRVLEVGQKVNYETEMQSKGLAAVNVTAEE